ncbi:MAG: preprotein translocase subunit SecY [Clostridia bacterium]|nr:preprotein translocase subunit SecY [Clostridia bacterium]
MLQTIRNAWKLPELRGKILFTLFILLIYRFGSVLPVPFVDSEFVSALMGSSTGIFQYFNILSGEAFSKANLFALSISPYITASIVMQLLTIAIPYLENLAKEGDEGRKKISRITRYVTVILGVVTAIGYYTYIKNMPAMFGATGMKSLTNDSFFAAVVIVACYSAGAAIIMWLAEKINEHGTGNGISLILLANIVSRVPSLVFSSVANLVTTIQAGTFKIMNLVMFVVVVVVALAMVTFVVHMNSAERRVSVQYAKRQVGRRMYGGQNTYLPLKLNMTGVMPIIFASSIVALPSTIGLMFGKDANSGGVWGKILGIFSTQNPFYAILTFVLIIAFAYFYISISFNPVEVANNLKKNGGSILGIRPGKPTTDYIAKILSRITLIGAIFLGLIATVPLLVGLVANDWSFLAFGGSSIIIVVGVIIETVTEIETQMTMRHYKGFLE